MSYMVFMATAAGAGFGAIAVIFVSVFAVEAWDKWRGK